MPGRDACRSTDERELRRAAERLRRFLAGGPRRQREIAGGRPLASRHRALDEPRPRASVPGPGSAAAPTCSGSPRSGSGPSRSSPSSTRGEHLVRRYLGAFGPAPRTDIADWAGMRVGALGEALERMELRRFRDEQGRELLDLPRAPLPPAETPAPVRFLPTWDATLLVHARRTGILAERAPHADLPRPATRSRSRRSSSTAQVAGIWRHEGGARACWSRSAGSTRDARAPSSRRRPSG